MPRRILFVYLLLFGAAVPWYWQFVPLAHDALVMGMPAWAFAATLGSLAISLFSAGILLRPWPCEEAQGPPAEAQDSLAEAEGPDP